ncbi:interferon-induced very large GTPase 1-like [Stegastes partitus]|uniref:Interferon-induced very large GTPase 1-like n=1 Tax=Stegastes partitus TaxID=144197 RepID=A0A9Y4JSH0_9TELE|nr:PREDICTED: interferon-induced very large GTPase 1-like [Stegastes partitus]
MAEGESTMDTSEEEEEFHDAMEDFLEHYGEEGGPPATDYVPPPEVTVLHVGSDVISLGVAPSGSSVKYKLHIEYTCGTRGGSVIMEECSTVDVDGLNPGTEVTVSITRAAENGLQSKAACVSVFTEPVPPVSITVYNSSSGSVSLQWDTPAGEVESFIVACCSDGETVQELATETNSATVSSLRPGLCYSIQVSARLKNGRISEPAVTSARTKTHLQSLLEDLGLEQRYKDKLSLNNILEIDEKTITDQPAKRKSDLPWYFLKQLMMVNVTARNVKCTSVCESNCDAASGSKELDLKKLVSSPNTADMVNPLDIITALFLCSDGFVQQEMALKMSMCQQYFKQTEGHVYLVEGYKEEFSNSAKSLRREMESSVVNQLTAAADIRRGMRELDRIKENHTKQLEDRVHGLIEECRKRPTQMTDEELDEEFDKIWNETKRELSYPKRKIKDVYSSVFNHLRTNLSHRGSHASQLLSQRKLQDCGVEPYSYATEGLFNHFINKVNKFFNVKDHTMAVQKIVDSIIDACTQLIAEKLQRKTDYHDTYVQEILHIIDERFQNNPDVKTDTKLEVSLKQHICGFAARHFQKMHEDFLNVNDPYRCLRRNKDKFRADFKDVFQKRDQCQKKAEEFTYRCLKPAVKDFVNRSVGPDVIADMLTNQQFSTRMFFQFTVLLNLLSKDDFGRYLHYILSYEQYVKRQILRQILEHFTNGSTTLRYKDQHLKSSISSINDAINKAKMGTSVNLKMFVQNICKELGDKLVISQDSLGAFMILNNANQEQFAHSLTKCVNEMGQTLRKEFQESNIVTTVGELFAMSENVLFTQLIGCGQQCPFCEAPCDAGGKAHTEHWASLHRPTGLGQYRLISSQKLDTDICSSLVNTDSSFRCHATNNEWHPYKRYKEIFPHWKIAPDVSLEASDYWKYVMAKYNNEFAKEYNAKPAKIPATWKRITRKQAEASLKESFGIKGDTAHLVVKEAHVFLMQSPISE